MTDLERQEAMILKRAGDVASRVPDGKAHILPPDWHPELNLGWSDFDCMALALRILRRRGVL